MLLTFRAVNARSFREEVEFSLHGTRLSEEEVVRRVCWRKGGHPIPVLPVAGLFGANASGKTNLLRTMSDMRDFVLYSFQRGRPGGGMPTRPFLLGEDRGASPTTYEVELILNGVLHEFGFTIDAERVTGEWARHFPHGRAALLFHREGDAVRLGAGLGAKGRATIEILRPNALFLSTAAATAHPALTPLHGWFRRNLLFADVNTRTARQALTAEMLEEDHERGRVLALLREADLGITGASRKEMEPAMRERIVRVLRVLHGEEEGGSGDEEIEFDDFEVRLKHRAERGEVELAAEDESRGTLIWFGMIGPVIDALREGSVLLADELDASLHPALVNILVSLFQSLDSNPRRAQLVFNSHDVTLMDGSGHVLGRDQIWFTEKNNDGSTRLYPLTDLDPRKHEAIGRRYLAGRYGATPIVSFPLIKEMAAPVSDSSE